jgi:hypothetical protein
MIKTWSVKIVPAIEAYATAKLADEEREALRVAFSDGRAVSGNFLQLIRF